MSPPDQFSLSPDTRGHLRGFQNLRLWVSGTQKANLRFAYVMGVPVDEPWTLISNAHPSLDLVWSYAQRFCCEQLFGDQTSGLSQLKSSGLRDPERIDRLLLVVAIAVLVGNLQGHATSFSCLRRQVDPHWHRGMSFVRIGLALLLQFVANVIATLLAWLPIPLYELGSCMPSRGSQRRWIELLFTRVGLPPRLAQASPSTVS